MNKSLVFDPLHAGALLIELAGSFFGERLLEKDPETQRVLRSTFIASAFATCFGLTFFGLWIFLGDPRAMLLVAMLSLMWLSLLVLRRTLWREWMGFVFGGLTLLYWVLDAVVFNHLGPSTYAGIYLAPVAAFQFGSARMGRLFGLATVVTTAGLWLVGTRYEPILAQADPFMVMIDRLGLLFLLASFVTVQVYEQLFLERVLAQASPAPGVELFRLGLVETEESGHRAVDLGETLASVTHDLSNPLTYALGNLEFLLEGGDEEEDPLELMEEAYEGLSRISAILQGLEGRAEDESVISVEDLISSALRSTRSDLERRARLVVQGPSQPAAVSGTEGRLVQVLVNLLTNAVQATPRGGRSTHVIQISARLTPTRVEIVVSDTGHGIPASIIHRVQDPFFTTRGSEQGTGLGLAICTRIAEEHGGSLRLSSEAGVGTEVILSLPRLEGPGPVMDAPSEIEVWQAQESGLRVLVIDDDRGMLKLAQRALQPMRVTVIADSRAALALCEEQVFDVIVCDVMMPNLGGPQLYETVVARLPELADRFLFMTGGAFSAKAKAFVEQNADRVLQKPMQLTQLRQRVLQVATEAGAAVDRRAASGEPT